MSSSNPVLYYVFRLVSFLNLKKGRKRLVNCNDLLYIYKLSVYARGGEGEVRNT